MPSLTWFYPGARAYGRWTFTRSEFETDSAAASTATVTLIDPDDTAVVVAPVITPIGTDKVQVDWEYTLPADSVPGVWYAIIPTATALIAHDEWPFRVLRSRVAV